VRSLWRGHGWAVRVLWQGRVKGVQGLVLPVPPSANRWWRRSGTHMYKSTEARDYQTYVNRLARSLGIRMIRRPSQVAFQVTWYRDKKMGDLDKRLGIVLDALQGVVYENDSQIVEILAKRIDATSNPRIEVTVYEVKQEKLAA
jgi:Holliday junction resolvase RusA-like endonuclease